MVGWDQGDKSLRVLWNGGTQVYVRASPGWSGKVQGLCGDYNQNPKDDYKLQVWSHDVLLHKVNNFRDGCLLEDVTNLLWHVTI